MLRLSTRALNFEERLLDTRILSRLTNFRFIVIQMMLLVLMIHEYTDLFRIYELAVYENVSKILLKNIVQIEC